MQFYWKTPILALLEYPTNIKTLSKKIHLHSKFADNRQNPRKSWEMIQSLLPSKPSLESPIALKNNGQFINNSNVITTQVNDHFCAIGSNLTESIECVTGKQSKDFYKQKVSDSLYLEPPTTTKVLNQITSLRNKAVGHDSNQPFFS